MLSMLKILFSRLISCLYVGGLEARLFSLPECNGVFRKNPPSNRRTHDGTGGREQTPRRPSSTLVLILPRCGTDLLARRSNQYSTGTCLFIVCEGSNKVTRRAGLSEQARERYGCHSWGDDELWRESPSTMDKAAARKTKKTELCITSRFVLSGSVSGI